MGAMQPLYVGSEDQGVDEADEAAAAAVSDGVSVSDGDGDGDGNGDGNGDRHGGGEAETRKRLSFEASMPVEEVAAYLEALVAALKKRSISLRGPDSAIKLTPSRLTSASKSRQSRSGTKSD